MFIYLHVQSKLVSLNLHLHLHLYPYLYLHLSIFYVYIYIYVCVCVYMCVSNARCGFLCPRPCREQARHRPQQDGSPGASGVVALGALDDEVGAPWMVLLVIY